MFLRLCKIPVSHQRAIAKENRKHRFVRSLDGEACYPSLRAAASALKVSKKALAESIFYGNKCRGRYWEQVIPEQKNKAVLNENEEVNVVFDGYSGQYYTGELIN